MAKEIMRKVKNIIGYSARRKAFNHMIKYSAERPLDINVETSTICPLLCKFCCNRMYSRERNVMPIETFHSIIKEYVETWGGGQLE